MAAPLRGRRLVVIGDTEVARLCADLLEQLGAESTRIPRVVGDDHGGRLRGLDADGAIDGAGVLGEPNFPVVRLAGDPYEHWYAAGLSALAPAGSPEAGSELAVAVAAYGAAFQLLAAMAGCDVDLDAFACLSERASITGMRPAGSVSAGGSARFEWCADGPIVLNLARPDDVAALPALVGADVDAADWRGVSAALCRSRGRDLVETATLLGVPVAVPGEVEPPSSPWLIDGAVPRPAALRRREVPAPLERVPLVVDFTSMWAGPLAGALLADAGARVIKVESVGRPDGARLGPAPFFGRLNGGKESLSVDFASREDRDLLHRLVAAADVVLESSRPRALAALGHDAAAVAAAGTCWVSITGYGRNSGRVAFGDDAAVAGGLWHDGEQLFVGDAAADPLAGLAAAVAAQAAVVGLRGQLVEVPLAPGVAFARSVGSATAGRGAGALRGGPVHRDAARLGHHDAAIRSEFAG